MSLPLFVRAVLSPMDNFLHSLKKTPLRLPKKISPARLALKILSAMGLSLLGFLLFTVITILQLNWVQPGATTFMAWRALNGTKVNPIIPLESKQIPKRLRRAFVVLEDHLFYTHHGFDFEGIDRALKLNRQIGSLYAGGSTITQQLARNLFLTPHKNWFRKGLEALITLEMELLLPKDRILDLYMNSIEFGPGIFGLGAAAQYHYNKPFSKLNRDQMNRLAVIITSPLNYGVYNFGRNLGMIQRYGVLNRL